MTSMACTILHVSINRPWQEVYAFAKDPARLPLWASGLADGLEADGDLWRARGALGDVTIRFVPDNAFGIIDHTVTLADGRSVFNALRVQENGAGAEVLFTLLRQPGMDDESFTADAEWVQRDLERLKSILESGQHQISKSPSVRDRRIDYVEMNVADIPRSKAFYGAAFGWQFVDYGPAYCEFRDGRLAGGFTTTGPVNPKGGPLVILFADDLEATHQAIIAAGGTIIVPVFEFPGGRRFHFADPDGYELAVWTEV